MKIPEQYIKSFLAVTTQDIAYNYHTKVQTVIIKKHQLIEYSYIVLVITGEYCYLSIMNRDSTRNTDKALLTFPYIFYRDLFKEVPKNAEDFTTEHYNTILQDVDAQICEIANLFLNIRTKKV